MTLTAADIAAKIGGTLEGDPSVPISHLASLAEAQEGDLSFLSNKKYADQMASTKASAVIVPEDTEAADIYALIEAKGGRAVGLSGIDGRMIEAKMKDPRLGYVGEITKVRVSPILDLLEKDYVPVISTVASPSVKVIDPAGSSSPSSSPVSSPDSSDAVWSLLLTKSGYSSLRLWYQTSTKRR